MDYPIEMGPQELKALQNKGEKIVLIDVREPQEFAAASIPDSQLIPMQTVPGQLEAIKALANSNSSLAVLCHHGMRSLNVTHWLRQRGVQNCFSVSGGIDRWSVEIDPSVPRY